MKWLTNHWPRKVISLVIAMVIWMVTNASIRETTTLSDIPVRILNLPADMTLQGLGPDGFLNTKISLTITGDRQFIEEVTGKDLLVQFDAADQPSEWNLRVTRDDLISRDGRFDLPKVLYHVAPCDLALKQIRLITDSIPVIINPPLGEAPRGYHYIDVEPYQLRLDIRGPEDVLKRLKNKGIKLTFNLNDISRVELDALLAKNGGSDEVHFPVPASWRKVSLPLLSDDPIEINDPHAPDLKIHFCRQDLLPLDQPLPVNVYYPYRFSRLLNRENCPLLFNAFVKKINGLPMIDAPLLVQGVSRSFLDVVKDSLEICILAVPPTERPTLPWNVQVAYPRELEDRYVAKMMAQSGDDGEELHASSREDYLRNRFRKYLTRLRLYTPAKEKLELKIRIEGSTIALLPENL